ncbi:hypothetical protein JW905_05215 [bacterium]|nr:hypothetical protein [candidate division CSSED10-310 bacterium]
MKKLGRTGQRRLKMLHLLCAGLWLSAGMILILMLGTLQPTQDGALHGRDLALKFIDDFIIIPAALGCLLTGSIYGIWTRWGFFRRRWVTVKWLITIYGILTGTFLLGPWLNSLPPVSSEMGLAALSNAAYLHARRMNLIFGAIQVASLLFALVISVLKPWGRASGQ